jgi:probable rRNA maturation factor
MSLTVVVSLDKVRIPLTRDRVTDVARRTLASERVRDALISITFVTRRAIRALNRRHLRRDRDTDVIAFAFRPVERGARSAVVGDIYIAPDVARESARAAGIVIREEITRLVVHGTLHVLGYEHPETGDRTRSAMWKKQERLVQRVGARQ